MDPDDARVRDFLRRSMNVRVATLSSRGTPHITPLRFVYDGRSLYALTRTVTLVARHVRDRPRVVLLFDAEQRSGPVLRVRAHAVTRQDPRLTGWIERRAATRYFLRPGGIWNMLTHWHCLPAWVSSLGNSTPATNALIEFVPETAEFVPRPS